MNEIEVHLQPNYEKLSYYFKGLMPPSEKLFDYYFSILGEKNNIDQLICELADKYDLLNMVSELFYFASSYANELRFVKGRFKEYENDRQFKQQYNLLHDALENDVTFNGILLKSKDGNVKIDNKNLVNDILQILKLHVPDNSGSIEFEIFPSNEGEWTKPNKNIKGKYKIVKNKKTTDKTFNYDFLKKTHALYRFIKDNSGLNKETAIGFIAELIGLLGFPFDGFTQAEKEANINSAYNNLNT